jgi:hypothetical protein
LFREKKRDKKIKQERSKKKKEREKEVLKSFQLVSVW